MKTCCDDPDDLTTTLTALGHNLVMTPMTIGEGLVTTLMTPDDYLVMTLHDNTNDLCDDTDDHCRPRQLIELYYTVYYGGGILTTAK
jgi:hypothetical protein